MLLPVKLAFKANELQVSIVTFSNSPNASNLLASQQAWKNVRSVWEQGEGFLFGPVILPCTVVVVACDNTAFENSMANNRQLIFVSNIFIIE